MICCIIFDLDGVLTDTAQYHYLAWKKLADQLEIPFGQEDNEKLKGVSRRESLDIILGKSKKSYSEVQIKQMMEIKNQYYLDYVSRIEETELFEGVRSLLKWCKSLKIKTAVGSSSKNATLILERLKIKDCFDAIIDGSMVERAKPDPQIFLKAAECLNISPENCLVIEDSIVGIVAAKTAGMKVVGVGDERNLANADWVVAHVKELQQLKGWRK